MPKKMIVSRKQAVKPKAKLTPVRKFWIFASREKGWIPAPSAQECRIRGFEGHIWFSHQASDARGTFCVSHGTGLRVDGSTAKTREEAIRQARAYLREKGVVRLQRALWSSFKNAVWDALDVSSYVQNPNIAEQPVVPQRKARRRGK